jgi:hypothetical protein
MAICPQQHYFSRRNAKMNQDRETKLEPPLASAKKDEGPSKSPAAKGAIPPESKALMGSIKQDDAKLAKGMAIGAGGVGMLGLSLGAIRGKLPAGDAPQEGAQAPGSQTLVAQGEYDKLPFDDAFAAARSQVGAGGVFVHNGNLYNTFYEGEWAAMSPEERRAFFGHLAQHVDPPPVNSPANPEPKPDEPKPDEPKPDEPKPDEPKPDEPKPDEPKPDEPKPDEPKPDEPNDPPDDITEDDDLTDPGDPTIELVDDVETQMDYDYNGNGSYGDSGGSTLDWQAHAHVSDFYNQADVGSFDHSEP